MARSTGIEVRHARSCRDGRGGRCNCSPSYRAEVYLKREGRRVRKTFEDREEALAWREQALVAVRRGEMRPRTGLRLSEAAEEWLQGARDGTITNRSGDPYKPAAIRGYEKALRLRVLPELGDAKLADIRLIDVQALVDKIRADGFSASTIDSTINPLRAIYRRAVSRGVVAVNPTRGLEQPAIRSKPKRVADPTAAAALIAALPASDRPLWATAFYAGLRRGELRALRVGDVDLAAGVINVRRSWDDFEGEVAPKSAKGYRKVPIAAVLRDHLDAVRMPDDPEAFVFGETPTQPFSPQAVTRRADAAWKAAELDRMTYHEARHTFASLMIAAGVNAKALSTFMGHHSINITLDLYGHLMPGSEAEAAGMLDAFLAAAEKAAEDEARGAGAGQVRDSRSPHRAVSSGSQR